MREASRIMAAPALADNDSGPRRWFTLSELRKLDVVLVDVQDVASLLRNLAESNGEFEFEPRGLHVLASKLAEAAKVIAVFVAPDSEKGTAA